MLSNRPYTWLVLTTSTVQCLWTQCDAYQYRQGGGGALLEPGELPWLEQLACAPPELRQFGHARAWAGWSKGNRAGALDSNRVLHAGISPAAAQHQTASIKHRGHQAYSTVQHLAAHAVASPARSLLHAGPQPAGPACQKVPDAKCEPWPQLCMSQYLHGHRYVLQYRTAPGVHQSQPPSCILPVSPSPPTSSVARSPVA